MRSVADLGLARVTESGVVFMTGRPVTFRYVRNTQKSPNLGARFGQDIEPAGYYVQHVAQPGPLPTGWIAGTLTFRRPLVLRLSGDPDSIYGPSGWKARLHRWSGGKKGASLSRLLVRLGYDGIVTVSRGNTSEIVGLRA